MTKKNSHLNAQEEQLIERLRQHPELMERFQNILEISASTEDRSRARTKSKRC